MKKNALFLALPLVLFACERPLVDGEAEINASLGSYEQVEGITEVSVYSQPDMDDPTTLEWYEATMPVGDDVSMVLLGIRGGIDHPALDDGTWSINDTDAEDFRAYLIGCIGPEYGAWDVDLNAPADLQVERRADGRIDLVATSVFEDEGFATISINGL